MIAWVWPDSTVRSTPLRISLGPSSVATETCRSLISKVDMGWRAPFRCSDAGGGELGLDGRLQPLPQLGNGDLAEDLAEEPAYDQPPRDRPPVCRGSAGRTVARRRSAPVALACPAPAISPVSISRLGTESARAPVVRTRLRLSSKVSVASAVLRIEDVADPDRAGAVALQRVLVVHPRTAVRLAVVDEQPLLEVLPRVGEAEAHELGVAARRAVGDGRADPHQVAAQRYGGGAQGGVAAEREVVGADVHRVVGPLLGDDQGEPRRRRPRRPRGCRPACRSPAARPRPWLRRAGWCAAAGATLRRRPPPAR